jgi:hypothetical protein
MMKKTASRVGLSWLRALLIAKSALLWAGCGGSAVSRGAEFYTQGRYIDAAQVFEHTEGDLRDYTEAERARYGLYRGATLLALGYAENARHWLNYGSALANESLSESERSALFEVLLPNEVSRQRRAAPRPLSPFATMQPASVLLPRVP